MPSSRAQVRWAHAVLAGKVKGDRNFAAEVVSAMHGRSMSSLPARGGKKVPLKRLARRKTKRT